MLRILFLVFVSLVQLGHPLLAQEWKADNSIALPIPVSFNAKNQLTMNKESYKGIDDIVSFMKQNPFITLLKIESYFDDKVTEEIAIKRGIKAGEMIVERDNSLCKRLTIIPVRDTLNYLSSENHFVNFLIATINHRPVKQFEIKKGMKAYALDCTKKKSVKE